MYVNLPIPFPCKVILVQPHAHRLICPCDSSAKVCVFESADSKNNCCKKIANRDNSPDNKKKDEKEMGKEAFAQREGLFSIGVLGGRQCVGASRDIVYTKQGL